MFPFRLCRSKQSSQSLRSQLPLGRFARRRKPHLIVQNVGVLIAHVVLTGQVDLVVAHDVAPEVELVFERLEAQRTRYTLGVVDETDVLSQVGDVTVDAAALGARARVQRVWFERVP